MQLLRNQRRLILLLIVSWLIRVILAFRGGQTFFPDEVRYVRCFLLLQRPWFGEGNLFSEVAKWHDHPGFAPFGLIAAAFQYLASHITGTGLAETYWVATSVLALAPVGSIALVYGIARKSGADEDEALLAALFMACSTSLTFFSRHLLPYDASLLLTLLALWLGLEEQSRARRSFICGILIGAAFLTYFGYWTIAFVAGTIHLCHKTENPAALLQRLLPFIAGAILPIALLHAASLLVGAVPFVSAMLIFSRHITQGDFSEGWRVPLEFLWGSEGGLLIIWMGGALIAGVAALRDTSKRRVVPWIMGVVGIYVCFSVLSSGLSRFVVYGRLVRQMIPFFCLSAACGITYAMRGLPSRIRLLVPALICVLAAMNLYEPFIERFPAEIKRETAARFDSLREDATVSGPEFPGNPATARYVLLNAQFLWPITGKKPPPAGRVLFSVPHPLSYQGYQFEDKTRAEREILASTDISIRLIDTASAP